jgi:alkanesulfonate monooxygenase SsuD/methylene tetrahydromethanopterin reductase-like flavin-dependent oxidoreductase (luciferase family)
MLIQTAEVLRSLWRGENVEDIQTMTGCLSGAGIGVVVEDPPPLLLAALGPKTQELAGQHFDGVLLHPFWTREAIQIAVTRIRNAAARADRDPSQIGVWSCLVMAPGGDEVRELEAVVRRLTTYLQLPAYGELIASINDWDPAVLKKLRQHPVLAGRVADQTEFTSDELRSLRDDVYPSDWLQGTSAVGDSALCASELLGQFDAGCDGVLIHGSSPAQLEDVLSEYRLVRPHERFAGMREQPCSIQRRNQ